MKDYLKKSLMGIVLMTFTIIPVFVIFSIYENSFNLVLFFKAYVGLFLMTQIGIILDLIISPILDKIAEL